MFTLQPLVRKFIAIRYLAAPCVLLASLVAPAVVIAQLDSAQRVPVSARLLPSTTTNASSLVDAGPVPASQPATVTLRLAPAPDRAAALDQLLADQSNPASPSYHHWLTPQQFAASYGASDDQIAALTTWAQSQGLTVSSLSAGKTRLTLSGTTDQVQQAFAVSLHAYVVSGIARIATTTQPSVPLSISPMVAGISGLDSLPPAISASVTAISPTTGAKLLSTTSSDPLDAATAAIDANAAPVLSLNQSACGAALTSTDLDAYRAAFRQANAQGITILANSTCPTDDSASQPSPLLSIPEVTAVTVAPASSDAAVTTDARPSWQVAPGLPADTLRHQPDLETTSVSALAQTLTNVTRQTGTPQGNINAALYSLATTPDLYTQPDAAPAGTWEPATGLGLVDLNVLARALPRTSGAISTTTALASSNYTPNYGQQFSLTATITPSSTGTQSPTGTVTFSSSTQGVVGTAPVTAGGLATLNVTTALNVGTYNLVATYGGDANYAGSASTSSVVVTVSLVNATIMATIAPTSVPYGSTATVTATVTLPGANASPSGTVTAVVEGVTGTTASATLTPNPGGNTATANITFGVPSPGSYTVQVTCAGNTNFQCQSPANVPFNTVKGNTLVTVTATPVSPQAGQPVTLTANVSAAGNGPGPYSFTGTMTFFDNGKQIATGPVGSNQASASVTLAGNVVHNIIASYSGDSNWNPSASPAQTVIPTLLPSTMTLTSNVTTALAGANIVITATVFTTAANTVGPTGTVSFYDTYNSAIIQLGAITLTPNGPNQSISRFSTTGLLAGVHSIYAVYNGDANFSPATSSTLSLNITDYNVIMNPPTLTLKAGQTGQVVMLVGAIGGFSGTVSFGCTPPAGAEATCSFSPASLQGGGATTMTILTTAAHDKPTQQAALGDVPPGPGRWPLAAGSILALLSCFILPRRRRAVPLLLTALLAVSFFPSLGCGAGASAGSTTTTTPTDPGTPLGTQIFTITTAGNDGVNTTRHNYQYQVTIQ